MYTIGALLIFVLLVRLIAVMPWVLATWAEWRSERDRWRRLRGEHEELKLRVDAFAERVKNPLKF